MRAQTLLVCLLLSACGVEDPTQLELAGDIISQPPVVTSVLHRIRPSDTDPAIGQGGANPDYSTDEYHYVYDYSANASPLDPVIDPKLFVFLPGGGPLPNGAGPVQVSSYTDLLMTARGMGYHVIGLDYPRPQSLQAVCGSDLDCYLLVRLEIAFGINASPAIDVAPADSIEYRLRALLIYLVATYPNGGWERFLDANQQIRWSLITLSGHRGFEAFIAHYKSVHRVVMFAGPVDGKDNPTTSASWIAPGATAPSRHYGIVHASDSAMSHLPRIKKSWTNLQMTPTNPVAIENGGYFSDHKLISNYPCTGTCDPHLITVIPNSQAAEDHHVAAWRYLMGDGD